MSSILETFDQLKNQVSQIDICVMILAIYNCRAAEVLSADWNNYYADNFLILKGCKRSNNVVIRDRNILDMIGKIPRIFPPKIFFAVTYKKLYDHIKKYYSHLFIQFKTSKHYKVTHGFRYLNVSKIVDEKFVRDILHHRSIRSGEYYKQTKRRAPYEKKKI
jgi:hypothetical protein